MTELHPAAAVERGTKGLHGFSPEAVFVLGGISQNAGTILAKSLFDEVEPATVALVRVAFAGVVLLALSWRHWLPVRARAAWRRQDVAASVVFGIAIALMNLFFYLAIDRLDVGKGLAIEFTGPMIVAATQVRSRRNALALALVLAGVVLLSGLEIDGNPLGLLFIFLASSMWATYILIGTRVARQERGLAGLGVGLVAGTLVLAPLGVAASDGALTTGRLVLACCLVGLLTTVIGHGLDQHVMRRIAPGRFALLLALLPVTATLLAFVALDERPGPLDVAGIVLVVAGLVSQQRRDPPVPAEDAAT